MDEGKVGRRDSEICPDECSGVDDLILIVIGGVFLSEGIQNFLFSDALGVGRFARIGIPAPETTAPFVGVVEIVFGAFILPDFLRRLSAIPLLIVSVAIARAVRRGFSGCFLVSSDNTN